MAAAAVVAAASNMYKHKEHEFEYPAMAIALINECLIKINSKIIGSNQKELLIQLIYCPNGTVLKKYLNSNDNNRQHNVLEVALAEVS